ncbi:hypothetical protein E3N88_17768 [Mikania micrantha]|nr:hypothetical protein E3N88_17768 [Mikania micrantha]
MAMLSQHEDNKLDRMQASRARLFKEYKEVQREKVADPDIQLVCDDSNIFKWTALIKGPSETPYEGGVFQLAFSVPEQYPLQPPQVRFLTKIFHPNVHFKTGEICLDILKNAWSPAWTLQSVCRAIIALMAHPEPDSPLNCDSGNLLRSGDVRGFQSMAKMYTRLAAMPKKGEHATTLTYSRMRYHVMQAAQTLVNKGYDPEVIDIMSLKPFDLYTIGNSIKKTHRVLIVELGHVYPLILLRMVDDISDWTLEIN